MNEMLLRLQIEPLAEGGFLATSDVLPGLVAQGRTLAETVEIAQDVARKILDSYAEHGDPLPLGVSALASGPVEVQVPVGLP
ncbi:MAG: type II toxin-antitoxin system HicB family antitoxin [Planctomycetes bacterium]|nr:type II toxin-antitoxin system HicB family antitoxin [Planctomycetota bacterium]